MGGTSTDVSHFAGEFERAFETQVAGVRMRAPMMSIHTVAAGGGSILRFDGARFRVGPESAGANPGPACYRRGGPLAVTDANVMLGKIQPALLPEGVRPARRRARWTARSWSQKFAALAAEIERATGAKRTPEEVAEGFIDIAVGAMANAIKKISVARGYDVTRYTLQCFGGAGGQHACRVADALGMDARLRAPAGRRAVGLRHGAGRPERDARGADRAAAGRRAATRGHARARRAGARGRARAARARASAAATSRVHRRVHLRYEGTDSALVVPFGSVAEMQAAFEAAYRQRFAFLMSERRAGGRGGVGRGRSAPAMRRPKPRRRCVPSGAAPAADDGAPVQRRPLVGRRAGGARAGAARAMCIDGPAIIAEQQRHHRRRARLAARASPRSTTCVLERVQPREAAPRDRHHGRPGDARGLQQPVHEHRRADGAAAAEHRLLGEHQGAARLLLRAVRRATAT